MAKIVSKEFILFLLLIPLFTVSQSVNYFGRTYSDSIPVEFNLDVFKLREHIHQSVPTKYKKGDQERDAFRFANESAHSIKNLITSGKIYTDWPSLEAYLNKILKKVLPIELKGDSMIRAFIVQDADYNAFMTPSGYMFVNIGLLVEACDESEIAAVISHELAHYYLKHSLRSFLEQVNGVFDFGLLGMNTKMKNRYSVKKEVEADSLAMVWLLTSGYNLNGLVSSFETMLRFEKNKIRRLEDKWVLEETTHPLSEKRLEMFSFFSKKHISSFNNNFIISESDFYRYKEEAKVETLKELISNFEYYSCIETAFRFHLFDPDNTIYIYYLLESIRRLCYLDSELWSKMFVTNRYYEHRMEQGHRYKEKMKANLFKNFDLEILPIALKEGVKIKARFYWKGVPKFTTYEEAFVFFYNVSQTLNCHECVLSNALSYTSKKETRNQFLENYLSQEDIKYRDFAQNLLKGTILKVLEPKKLICFNDFRVLFKYKSEKFAVYPNNPSGDYKLKVISDSIIAGQKNVYSIFMPSYKFMHLNYYKKLQQLENFSMVYTFSKGERTELSILAPEYWNFFKTWNVNEIEFVNSTFVEFHGTDRSIETYKRVVDQNFDAIFSRSGQDRYLNVFVSSVRQIENAVMKIRYYDGEKELNAKSSSELQIVNIIKSQLKLKEKFSIEMDRRAF